AADSRLTGLKVLIGREGGRFSIGGTPAFAERFDGEPAAPPLPLPGAAIFCGNSPIIPGGVLVLCSPSPSPTAFNRSVDPAVPSSDDMGDPMTESRSSCAVMSPSSSSISSSSSPVSSPTLMSPSMLGMLLVANDWSVLLKMCDVESGAIGKDYLLHCPEFVDKYVPADFEGTRVPPETAAQVLRHAVRVGIAVRLRGIKG
ncbi:hypothetical protein KEM55_003811, partial [Ascosphaera atra]